MALTKSGSRQRSARASPVRRPAYPATVTLTQLVPYGNGEQAYSVMAISVPSAPSRSETFSTRLVP